MVRRDNFHSRLVAWLKILLPLAALGLLSTLFLLSRNVDPTTTIPYASGELQDRVEGQQITDPQFAGATDKGDLISVQAAAARPDPDNDKAALAEDLTARIDMADGGSISFRADTGRVEDTQVSLSGGVVVESSNGYTVTSDQLISEMNSLNAESPGPVEGQGPAGQFSAGRMQITRPEGATDAQLLFTDGVKLVYEPAKAKD